MANLEIGLRAILRRTEGRLSLLVLQPAQLKALCAQEHISNAGAYNP